MRPNIGSSQLLHHSFICEAMFLKALLHDHWPLVPVPARHRQQADQAGRDLNSLCKAEPWHCWAHCPGAFHMPGDATEALASTCQKLIISATKHRKHMQTPAFGQGRFCRCDTMQTAVTILWQTTSATIMRNPLILTWLDGLKAVACAGSCQAYHADEYNEEDAIAHLS